MSPKLVYFDEELNWPDALCHSPRTRAPRPTAPLWDYDIHGEPEEERTKRFDEALSICAACPVRARCYAWAKERRIEGIWGGQIFPDQTSTSLVSCEECGVRIHGFRKDKAAKTPDKQRLCRLCVKNGQF